MMNDYNFDAMNHVVAFDFDGVVNDDSVPWKSVEIIEGKPMPGIRKTFDILRERGYRIVIHTCRAITPEGRAAVIHWLIVQGLIKYVEAVTAQKPIAKCYIDDRAIHFDGCDDLVNQIEKIGDKQWN